MNPIFGLFNLLALLYIFRGVQIVWQIVRQWGLLLQEPLTRAKKWLGDQAAFFVAVPPSVALHELFHALATWLVGGQIVDFGYGGFWGYVVPVGDFTPAQDWFIAIAGTLANLIFGAVLWLALRHHRASSFRYFGLRAFRFQLYFALVYYPIFTIFLPTISDWRIIYDFSATPVLSAVTAVLHIASLVIFYRADRAGWFEMAGFETVNEQAAFESLAQQATQNPQDRALTMQMIDGLRRGDAEHKATYELQQYLLTHPEDGDATALLAALQAGKNNHVPAKSKDNAEKALRLGIQNPRQEATAYRLLGEYALERNQYQAAVNQFSQALTALRQANNQPDQAAFLAYLYHSRSLAYRRQGQYDQAYQDMTQAVQLSQQTEHEQQTAVYQQELHIIEQQAGRPLGSSYNPHADEDVV
ncbi:MAG TPA: hypothetical protein PLD25_09690 [Chloroflexota bacterium]|nr:hypothetical protein [Chloroflexota bacterium]